MTKRFGNPLSNFWGFHWKGSYEAKSMPIKEPGRIERKKKTGHVIEPDRPNDLKQRQA